MNKPGTLKTTKRLLLSRITHMTKPNNQLQISWSEHKNPEEGNFTKHIIKPKNSPFRITVIDVRSHFLPGIYYQLDYPDAHQKQVFEGSKPTAPIRHLTSPGISGIRLKIPFEDGKPQYELLAATTVKGKVGSTIEAQTMGIAQHREVKKSLGILAKYLAQAAKHPTAHDSLVELNEHLQNVHSSGIDNMRLSDGSFDLHEAAFFKIDSIKRRSKN